MIRALDYRGCPTHLALWRLGVREGEKEGERERGREGRREGEREGERKNYLYLISTCTHMYSVHYATYVQMYYCTFSSVALMSRPHLSH